MKLNQFAFAGSVLAALALQPAHAQTAPKPAAKPAATPAAKPAETKTLGSGGGSRGGPILTRDELRVCISQEASLKTRLSEQEARRGPLDQEKEQIAADQAKLRADAAPLEENKRVAEALSVRVKEFGVRVEAWNKRTADFNASGRTGPTTERVRRELATEREDIDKAQKDLEAERTRLSGTMEEAVRTYNAKAAAMDQRVSDWNQRNQAANEASRTLDGDRKLWLAECGDRRYREEDEAAIKRGK